MSDHGQAESAHPPVTAKTFVWVWIFLVALTGIEVYLGYIELEPKLMLTILVGLDHQGRADHVVVHALKVREAQPYAVAYSGDCFLYRNDDDLLFLGQHPARPDAATLKFVC